MNRRPISTHLILLFFSTVTIASAQQNARVMTLNQCIETGLLRNISIIRAENAVVGAESRKMQSYGNFLPTLDASASWSRADKAQVRYRNEQMYVSNNSYTASLRSGLSIFDGFANVATVQQSIRNQHGASFDLARTKQDITFQIQAAYYNVLRFKRLKLATVENMKRSRKQLERIQEMNRVGSVPLADVYRQQVQVGRDELTLIQTDNDVKNSLADLAFLIGLRASDQFDVEESAIENGIDSIAIREFRRGLASEANLYEKAIESRADYLSAREQRDAADNSVTIARSGYYPSLDAFAQYGWSDFDLNEFVKEIGKKDYFTVGLSLSIPILGGLRTSNAVEQALIVRRNAEENVSMLERQISVELRKALNQLDAAEKNIETTNRNLIAATEDLRMAEERYAIGTGTLLDQITANASFIAAQTDRLNSIFNYLTARKQVEYYLGISS